MKFLYGYIDTSLYRFTIKCSVDKIRRNKNYFCKSKWCIHQEQLLEATYCKEDYQSVSGKGRYCVILFIENHITWPVTSYTSMIRLNSQLHTTF